MAESNAAKTPPVEVAGERLSIDEDSFTLEEVEDVEQVTGKVMAKILSNLAHCAICDTIHQPEAKPLPEIGAKGKRVRPATPPKYDHPHFPRLSAREFAGLIWVTKRRSDPNFTFDMARSYTIGEVFAPVGEASAPKGTGGHSA